MIDWKAQAKRYRRQLRAELSGSRKLYLALVEATKRRLEAGPSRLSGAAERLRCVEGPALQTHKDCTQQ